MYKKVFSIVIAIVLAFSFTGCGQRELREYKKSAKESLDGYVTAYEANGYTGESLTSLLQTATEEKLAIDAAADKAGVDTALETAKQNIDVKTKQLIRTGAARVQPYNDNPAVMWKSTYESDTILIQDSSSFSVFEEQFADTLYANECYFSYYDNEIDMQEIYLDTLLEPYDELYFADNLLALKVMSAANRYEFVHSDATNGVLTIKVKRTTGGFRGISHFLYFVEIPKNRMESTGCMSVEIEIYDAYN